jgi:hypothetical protein
MTEAAQAPYKGPFSVKHHSDTEMADHYWIEDANGKAIRGVDLRDAQWLRDTLNAATRPGSAAVDEAEIDRIMALSDQEVIAETIAAGEDPDQIVTEGRALLAAAIVASRALDAAAGDYTHSQSNSELQRTLMHDAFFAGAEYQRMVALRAAPTTPPIPQPGGEREIDRLLASDVKSEPAYVMPDGSVETLTDHIGLIFMHHVHANVSEEQRPNSWADFSDEQIARIRTAAREAIAAWQAARATAPAGHVLTEEERGRLDEIKERERRATPGKWEAWNGCSWWRIGLQAHSGRQYEIISPTTDSSDGHPNLTGPNLRDDLTFAAHARQDIPLLLAIISRLTSTEPKP